MRIDQLDLIRYGKFTERSLALPQAARDFHVIVGPNEAGKSTLRSAIHHLLYGFPLRDPGYAFLHPLPDLRLGARLRHAQRELAFHRIKANRATLRRPDDSPLPDDALAPFLGGVEPRFFEQMFSLDHERLVRGGASILSAADEDVGQVLFESAAGIASLGEIRAELEQEANALWARRKSSARVYYQAEQACEEARQALRAASLRAKDWAQVHARVEELGALLQTALAEQARLRARRSVLQRVRRVAPLLATLDSEAARLAEHADAAELPPGAAATLDEAEPRLAAIAASRAHHLLLEQQAQQRLAQLHPDTALIELEPEIVALDELRLQYRAYPNDIEKRELEVRARWAVVTDLAAQLGWEHDGEQALAARMPSQPARAALARLARQREALMQARDGAARALRQKQRELQQARSELQGLPQGHVEPTLRAAMARARALGDTAAVLGELQGELRSREHALEVARKALVGAPTAPEELAAMLPPTREHVQALLEQQRRDELEAARLEQESRKVDERLAELAAAGRRMREQLHPVLPEHVRQARSERDQVWAGMRRDPSTTQAQAERYELLVAHSDALADERHDRAHDAAELQGLEQRAEALGLEREALRAHIDAVHAARARRDREWARLRDECRLPALSAQAAAEWLQVRERVLDAWQAVVATRQRVDGHVAAACAAAAALAAQLRAAGQPVDSDDLAVLLNQADEHVRRQDESRGERKSLEQQLGAASGELHALRDTASAADDAYRAWQDAWQRALADAGFVPDDDVAKVEASLDVIARIGENLASIRQIRAERIDTMRADLRDLQARAQALAVRVKPELAQRPASDVAAELRRGLAEARSIQADAEQARASLAAAAEALARADREEQHIRASLAPLLERAAVDGLGPLRAAIARSDARRGLQAALEHARKALLDQGDGLSLAALREEAAALDPGAVMAELARWDAEEEATVRRIPELSAALSSADAELRAMAGQADAATAEAKRQEALAQMADAAERFIKVHTAARLLGWSIERYRDARQGPLLAAASAIFSGLTLGSFERLMVDFDHQPPSLHGRRPDGAFVGVDGMSEGTRDQLYLALRLAALDMHLARAHALPFVADDLFINFDDRRSRAGLQALAQLSQRTQVLFLTHHEHMVDLVREVYGDAVNIVRLSSP